MDERSFPDLNCEYRVTADQIKHFRTNGFLILRNVFARDEIEPFRWEIRRVSSELNQDERRLEERDAFGRAFCRFSIGGRIAQESCSSLRVADLGDLSPTSWALMGSVSFTTGRSSKNEAAGATQRRGIRISITEPRMELTACRFWLSLVDIERSMGGMKWASGRHMEGFLGLHAIPDESQAYYEDHIRAHNCQVVEGVSMSMGDVSFRYGGGLHAAGPNSSNVLREAMIGTYYADGMWVMQRTNPSQENDRVRYLVGGQPGEFADSDLNRLIYSRIQ